MPFCEFCRRLTIDTLNGIHRYHDDLKALKTSADSGCDLCSLCWAGFQRAWNAADIDAVLRGGAAKNIKDFDPSIWLSGFYQERGPQVTHPTIRVYCGEVLPASGTQLRNAGLAWVDLAVAVRDNSASASNIPGRLCTAQNEPQLYVQLIARWLRGCEASHALCCTPGDSVLEMPTRVVDVGDPNRKQRPRLVLTRHEMSERYVALSYCWGPAQDTFVLNDDTMEGMLQAIEESSLVAAHRDVFELARSLGIRFVWIDALCIVQGNAEDWERESGLMARVYGNAFLTVIAGRSNDARERFVASRLPLALLRSCEIPVNESGDSGVSLVGLARSREVGPVETRGWCLQEKLLSRRLVIFGEEQVMFKCEAGLLCEDGSANDEVGWTGASMARVGQMGDLGARREKLLGHWYSVVHDFSRRQLSNPHDVFAAIASLAAIMSAGLESRYLAGLWECDMACGLVWKPWYRMGPHGKVATRPQPTRLARSPVIRAPTWSWAAVQHRVFTFSSGRIRRSAAIYENNPPETVNRGAFVKVRPALRNPDRWSPSTECSAGSLHIASCELQMLGRVANASVLAIPIEEYLGRQGTWLQYQRWMAHLGSVLGVETEEEKAIVVAIGVFDVPGEEIPEVCCLQVTAQEGLMLSVGGDGKSRRVGWFVLMKEDWFDDAQEVRVNLV